MFQSLHHVSKITKPSLPRIHSRLPNPSFIHTLHPTTDFENPNPVILLSPPTPLHSKLASAGYETTQILLTSTTQRLSISELRTTTKSMYAPIIITTGPWALFCCKYVESWGASAIVFIEPVMDGPYHLEMSKDLWKSLHETKVSLEDCQETRMKMVVVAKERGVLVDRLKTDFIKLEIGYEDKMIEWLGYV